ncbi:hypothetical protein H671_21453 [Cricetulus griseus]|nr:hypothetical protein H671_21453 [Cricetulus griseus]
MVGKAKPSGVMGQLDCNIDSDTFGTDPFADVGATLKTRMWMAELCWILVSRVSLWFQLIHQLHGVGSHLEGPKAARLQLRGDVDGAVNGHTQALDVDLSAGALPLAATVQQLLAAGELALKARLHVDINVIGPPGQAVGKSLAEGVHSTGSSSALMAPRGSLFWAMLSAGMGDRDPFFVVQ